MKYILIGSILGSLVTSSHDNEEACVGRKEMLRKEFKITAECYKEPSNYSTSTLSIGRPMICSNGVCQ